MTAASLDSVITEMANRSARLFGGAFELVEDEDLHALLEAVSADPDEAGNPVFMAGEIDEDHMEDFVLQEVLAGKLDGLADGAPDLSSLDIDVRENLRMALEEYLGVERDTSFEYA